LKPTVKHWLTPPAPERLPGDVELVQGSSHCGSEPAKHVAGVKEQWLRALRIGYV
jgi:hypothetical protein